MGLTLAQSYVRRVGGRMALSSTPQGTHIEVDLPLETPPSAAL